MNTVSALNDSSVDFLAGKGKKSKFFDSAKKFVHNELGLADLFGGIKYIFYRFLFGTLGGMKDPELEDKVLGYLSQT